jgi:hypothetical protein
MANYVRKQVFETREGSRSIVKYTYLIYIWQICQLDPF